VHQQGIYGAFTDRDQKIWAVATQRFVDQGDKIFHDAKLLGGTISVSCDMCHPNAANTHPETYPKFQVQLGRVALLRDMINWCIQNPVRGKPLPDDDPKLKALEAYIIAQRKGVVLEYGKH
jgi:cytochrome c